MGPREFGRALFDVAGDVDPKEHGRYDLVISRMVMEHVRDAARAWANMANLLAPGGVALAFHPTLYAQPFVINWLIPERLTAPVLKLFFSDRHDGDSPKFPARYDLCIANPAVVAARALARFERAFLGRPLFPAFAWREVRERRPERARRRARLAMARELRLHGRTQVRARGGRGGRSGLSCRDGGGCRRS
jgi:SAM-dependent methyltransferase